MFVALWALLLAAGTSAAAPQSSSGSLAQAFIFVLDGSGSMERATVPDGRTRWEAAKASIASTIESLPQGFGAEILVFGSEVDPSRWSQRWTINGSDDRAAAVAFAGTPRERSGRAWNPERQGTSLYDAMGWAFTRAETLCRDGTQVSIVVLSDGKDESSKIWSPDGDGGQRRSLCRALATLRRSCLAGISYRFSRTSREIVPPCDPDAIGESIVFTTLPIVARPEGPTEFASLADGTQRIALQVEVPPNFSIAGLDSMDVRFVPDPGEPSVRLDPPQVRLANGRIELAATAVGPAPDAAVRGVLRFVVGKPKTATAIVMPPRDIPIGFAAPAKVSLDPGQVVPADGAVFLKGRPIRFAAPEVAGATATWQFGDGASATGFTVSHAYASEGEKTFTLSVTKPGSQAFSISRRLRIVDISVAIVPPSALPIAGEEVVLEARTSGPVKSIRWQIDSFDVAAGSDGRLRYRYAAPGTYEVRAIAVTDFGDFDARLPVSVGEGASIVIVRPDSQIAALVPTTFRAVVTGPIAEVRWSVTGADGSAFDLGIAGGIDRVEPIGQDRVSEFTATLPAAAAAAGPVTIAAAAVLPPELATRIGGLDDSVEREVLPPGLFTTIASPIAGETLPFDREAVFTARLTGSGLSEVRVVEWRFLGSNGQLIAEVSSDVERMPDRPDAIARVAFTPTNEHGDRFSVEAAAIGAAGAESAKAAFPLRLELPPYELACPDAATGIAGLGRNLKFEVLPGIHIEEVRFDFGDGGSEIVSAAEGALAAFHRFGTGGTFDVRAVARFVDGRSIALGPLRLLVEARPPVALLKATLRGDPLAEARMVDGGTIAIADESTGDIGSRRWTLTGPIDPAVEDSGAPTRMLDAGAESVVIEQDAYGTYLLRLEVVGIPERPGVAPPTDAIEIAFENRRPRDWTTSILAASIGGFLTIFAFWFAAGQYPRRWKLNAAVGTTRDPSPLKVLELHGFQFKVGNGRQGRWNWWRKSGEVDLQKVIEVCKPRYAELLFGADSGPTSAGDRNEEAAVGRPHGNVYKPGKLLVGSSRSRSGRIRLESLVLQLHSLQTGTSDRIGYQIPFSEEMVTEEFEREFGGAPAVYLVVTQRPRGLLVDFPLVLVPVLLAAATVSAVLWSIAAAT